MCMMPVSNAEAQLWVCSCARVCNFLVLLLTFLPSPVYLGLLSMSLSASAFFALKQTYVFSFFPAQWLCCNSPVVHSSPPQETHYSPTLSFVFHERVYFGVIQHYFHGNTAINVEVNVSCQSGSLVSFSFLCILFRFLCFLYYSFLPCSLSSN